MSVKLSELKPAPGSTKSKKRVGRGSGSGTGKTSGRGHKGQKSRSGYSRKLGFEGGQMPLIRRVPKRGFTNIHREEYQVVNLKALNVFSDGAEITPEILKEKGIVKKLKNVKILGYGELTVKDLKVKVHALSSSAIEKIKAANGVAEVL